MVQVTKGPIATQGPMAALRSSESGAVVAYLGTVRSSSEGRRIRRLVFEVADSTLKESLGDIETEVRQKFDVQEVAILHRTGVLEVGDNILFVAVSAGHRGPAFEACQYAIKRIKELHTRWKKEDYLL